MGPPSSGGVHIIQMLNKDLIEYFEKHSDTSYDLWRGGSAKSNVSNPKFWKPSSRIFLVMKLSFQC